MNKEWNWLKKRADIHPEKTAVIDGESGHKWTYGEVYKKSLSCAKMLEGKGIKSGDRVVLIAPNGVEYLILLFACRELEAIFVPFNWRLTVHELNDLISDCKPVLLFIHPSFLHLQEKLSMDAVAYDVGEWKEDIVFSAGKESLALDQPWMMIYTGGTTGKPKGAVLSYRSVFTNSANTIITWGLSEKDTTLTILPMFHTGGINALTLPVLHAGGTVVIYSQFKPQAILEGLLSYQCTVVLMVPTMYRAFIKLEDFQKETFPHMDVFLSGGAPCPVSIYDAFEGKGLPFKEGYGLTEAGPNNFFIDPSVAKKKRGSVGKPMLLNDVKLLNKRGNEVKCGEIGEMVIFGDHLFQYYWQKEEETKKAVRNGGLHTGDLAYQDQDGDFFILGRKKEMLISGGENVYPIEIENILSAYPGLLEAAVVGLPDEKWGEKVVCAVALEGLDQGDKHTDQLLQAFCREKLAGYKVPKEFYLMEELPKTHVGKIDKKAIVEHVQNSRLFIDTTINEN
ncbi:fatty-acyl-CoA synthase [Evansella vedderi]|uniref:Fatty-acyl-CoA synthase n=1 Tax=Evansella vedderi TaxID=38282 RepID=A0ABU0A093_9BACI|nr:AMP-binding protein [Evansella vedderi]MDQ0256905.1 fatty-acyl-CoA synthase [Evansella vedderi]